MTMRQHPDMMLSAICAQQLTKADGVQTRGLTEADLADYIVATGTIAGGQHGVAAGHRATGQNQRQNDGLTWAGWHAETTAITLAAIKFERGVVQPPGSFRANIDASVA